MILQKLYGGIPSLGIRMGSSEYVSTKEVARASMTSLRRAAVALLAAPKI
jgi:hypothetical protein